MADILAGFYQILGAKDYDSNYHDKSEFERPNT
jgi:hypothetical protein